MIRVFVQCKALKTKLGPNLVRELEGTFHTTAAASTSDGGGGGGKVGILVSPREATKGVRDAMARSAYPVFWMMVERDGTLQQALWNSKVEELGLGLLGVETRFGNYNNNDGNDAQQLPSAKGKGRKALGRSIALTWDGHDLPDMDQIKDALAAREAEWLTSWGDAAYSRGLSDVDKSELLNVVEESFPDARSEGGRYGGLSDDDRAKIRHELNDRLRGKIPSTETETETL